MMLRITSSLLLAAIGLALGGAPGCTTSCDRSGCEALQEPQSGAAVSQGIAGVVASQSDVCDNGCCACGFATARFDVWKVAAPVKSAAEASAIVSGSAPTLGFDAKTQYARELEAGDYLVCTLPGPCASLTIGAGDVFTVNAKRVFGPGELVVFAPNSATPSSGGVFVVNQTAVQ